MLRYYIPCILKYLALGNQYMSFKTPKTHGKTITAQKEDWLMLIFSEHASNHCV